MAVILAAKPLGEILEKEWELQVIGTAGKPGIARQLGWRVYHTLRSKGSQPGYPDWTLVRERVVFLELKTEANKVSPAQRDWLRALDAADAEVYVVRPRHLEQIGRVLAARKNGLSLGSHEAARAQRELQEELEELLC